ncbi:MAG: NifB/NifX family molybdenum-iron cluster-binding protein [Deltaproteobacteria bacterium]|nr:NifB/NifX family molybdenum-iron cluster-binding protein [Deltaproteobacteria bacterium]MBW2648419.1 NifB/NifX family molybdenum-iron cluster-binding protein [Deltaproteobacteria bacterium]
MKLAMPVWDDCVSTVLDFADCLLVVDCESEAVRGRSVIDLAGTTMAEKVARLRKFEIQVLLCGAVSRPMERMIMASGIEIIPFLRGRVDDVLSAYFSGGLIEPGFMLPGCRRGSGFGQGMGRRGRGYGRPGWNNNRKG